MKKIIALALALIMVLSMGTVAFAAETSVDVANAAHKQYARYAKHREETRRRRAEYIEMVEQEDEQEAKEEIPVSSDFLCANI